MLPELILASQSPRRQQLLTQAGLHFRVIIAATNEDIPEGLSGEGVAIHIASEKAHKVFNDNQLSSNVIIIAADTLVILNGEIIGKPKNREQAIQILIKLSGNTHQVITGVTLLTNGGVKSFAETTDVEFFNIDENDIKHYVDTYEPYDKAGAYAIQEWIGLTSIKKITGDFYNVMGLPVSRVIRELKTLKAE
jgi:septum formation protein